MIETGNSLQGNFLAKGDIAFLNTAQNPVCIREKSLPLRFSASGVPIFANGAVTAALAYAVAAGIKGSSGGRGSGSSGESNVEPSLAVGESRPLTEGEIEMSKGVFGDSVDYSKTKVFRKKFWIFQKRGMAMAPNGNIYFHPSDYVDDFSALNIHGRSWFIHEMTHVWQNQQGVNVMIKGATNRNYNYVPLRASFSSYGVEAQGSIVADYYRVMNGYKPLQGSYTLADYNAVLPFGR